jgi:hypothetical protein
MEYFIKALGGLVDSIGYTASILSIGMMPIYIYLFLARIRKISGRWLFVLAVLFSLFLTFWILVIRVVDRSGI